MKYQDLFSLKKNVHTLKCGLLILNGTSRINTFSATSNKQEVFANCIDLDETTMSCCISTLSVIQFLNFQKKKYFEENVYLIFQVNKFPSEIWCQSQ